MKKYLQELDAGESNPDVVFMFVFQSCWLVILVITLKLDMGGQQVTVTLLMEASPTRKKKQLQNDDWNCNSHHALYDLVPKFLHQGSGVISPKGAFGNEL